MQFKGTLSVTVAAEKNRGGQLPLTVEFVGEGGISLQVKGARLVNGVILDPVAIVNSKAFHHTAFSPSLQAAIIAGDKASPETKKHDEAYQKHKDAEMLARSRKAQGLDDEQRPQEAQDSLQAGT